MKFIEYIEERIKDEQEFDVMVGGIFMSMTMSFGDDWIITDYCKEKYADLFNSEIEIIHDNTGKYLDVANVLYNDDKVGRRFCWAVAGYVAEDEWNKMFAFKEE